MTITYNIIFRKKRPFFGKYKFKVELSDYTNDSLYRSSSKGRKITFEEIQEYLGTFDEETYKTRPPQYLCYIPVYIDEEDVLETFLKSKYKKYVVNVFRPAPGYDANDTTAITPGKTSLWYGRFPYKIVVNRHYTEPLLWCGENCFGDFRKSGYNSNVSFFFMNPIDATGFKLMFSDDVVETKMSDNKIAVKLLRNRVKEARADLKNFLDGGGL